MPVRFPRNRRSKSTRFPLIGWLAFGSLFIIMLVRLLVELVRRYRRRPPAPPAEIELVPEAILEWPTFELPPLEVLPEESPAETTWFGAEDEFSFTVPGVVAPPIPDVSLTVPPELQVLEAITTADGKTLYRFNWQNPVLRRKIYPYRLKKLRDFLLYYSEIDLCLKYKNKSPDDPLVKAKIQASQEQIRQRRAEVQRNFTETLAARRKADLTFDMVCAQNLAPSSLLKRQTYYLDRQIIRLDEKIKDRKDRRDYKLKRAARYPEDSMKYQDENAMAKALADEIASLEPELEQVRQLRQLFREVAELPSENITIHEVMRFEMNQLRERWKIPAEDHETSTQAQVMLLREIIDWINREPDRFPEWLVYMVIHFSGMRYMSAHSSYAEPRALLEMLKREEADSFVQRLAANLEVLKKACLEAVARLQAKPILNDAKFSDRLITRLKGFDRNALKEIFRLDALAEIEDLNDDQACLAALEQYRAEQAGTPDAMPEWVWAEICKYTPLRLQVTEPNWEATLQQRYEPTKKNWLAIMNTWETANVTSWRQKHAETLDLIVTRSVCNEIAEQIQHLRGLSPVAGLTARPKWYIRQSAKDSQRAYLRQSPKESDFKQGASILWLEYMDRPPTVWQEANPLPGYVFPGQKITAQGGKKDEKKVVTAANRDEEGWKYTPSGSRLVRTRPLPTPAELRKQGKTEKEITQIMAQRKVTGNEEVETLRWRHEATVVGVFDMLDGKYVMTFETGEIGLRLRPLSSLMNEYIFVGYVPHMPLPAELDNRLENMLRWERMLPGVPLKQRQRPKFIEDPLPEADESEAKQILPALPKRPALTIRRQMRCYTFEQRDQQGLPKMVAAKPPVFLQPGMRLGVAAGYPTGMSGPGRGVIKASGGADFPSDDLYLLVLECPEEPKACGLYVKLNETAEPGKMKTVVVKQQEKGEKVNLQYLRERNKAFIPLMMLPKGLERIQVAAGTRLRVSATHRDSVKDAGNGVIITDGGLQFYLILECEQVPQAAGYYISVAQVELVPD